MASLANRLKCCRRSGYLQASVEPTSVSVEKEEGKHVESEFFYFNTTDPNAEARPYYNHLEFVNEEVVQTHAERADYLILFEASRDEINAAAKANDTDKMKDRAERYKNG